MTIEYTRPDTQASPDPIPGPTAPSWLASLPCWLQWHEVPAADGCKATKVPSYSGAVPRRRGATDTPQDRAQLVPLAELVLAPGGRPGTALGLLPDGRYLNGLDLDSAKQPDGAAEWAKPILAAVFGTGALLEVSPSGKGFHALWLGDKANALGSNGSGVEVYGASRYFTFNGRVVDPGTGEADMQQVLALAAARHAQFTAAKPAPDSTQRVKVGRGGRNNFMWQTVVRLREAWLPYSGMLDALREISNEWLEEPLTEDELQLLARKGGSTAQPHPTADQAFGPVEGAESSSASGGFLASANDVQDENIEWVWRHRLAKGMVHLIAGQPGTGKSTIAFDWAAAISSGGKFPDGTPAPVGKVVIWSGEDSYSTTIKPRMRVAGANFDNVFFINANGATEFDPAQHMAALRKEVEALGDVSMVLIDPIVSAIKGDSHKNAEVRRDLQPFTDMLKATSAIGLGITHYTKGTSGRHIVERITGSIAFGAVARMAFATVQEKDNASRYRIVIGKTNIAPPGGGYEYELQQAEVHVGGKRIEATRIAWGEPLVGEPLKLIADAEGEKGRPPEKRSDAARLLAELLAGGPVLVEQVRKAAEASGISFDTMKRARTLLGAVAERADPGNPRSKWQWRSEQPFGPVGAAA